MMSTTLSALAGLDTELEQVVRKARRSLVTIKCGYGQGAGVAWSAEGLIVTNHHVAETDSVTVDLPDGGRYSGRVVARDAFNDLALVEAVSTGRILTSAEFRDDRELVVGDLVIAVGNPLNVQGAAALGIVGVQDARLWRPGRSAAERALLQADIQLAPGNSGGPLVDMSGRVVGIACMVFGPRIGIAVPSHVVHRFVDSAMGDARRRAA